MKNLIGRINEKKTLEKLLRANKSHFLALYGRRRVGKTYLIKQFFNNNFDFYASGLADGDIHTQLTAFHSQLLSHSTISLSEKIPESWLQAFNNLRTILENTSSEKKIVFIDELPWLDTPKSGFISALEYFWNSWASSRNDIFLITCGSAASWMVENLLEASGGLHNRVTHSLKIEPFTLHEVELFLKSRDYIIDKYSIVQLYMVFGGVPFYLEQIDNQISVAQNIERICFSPKSTMKEEYNILFRSLFKSPKNHLKIIDALANSKNGLTRTAIIKATKLPSGGTTTQLLTELELCNFTRSYRHYGKKSRDTKYQLIDSYTLFHHKHIKNKTESSNTWINSINTPGYYSWAGNAFEIVILQHTQQIKQKLGILGVYAEFSAFQNEHAQVDLIIDRKDGVINLVEAKFSIDEFEISKSYEKILRRKMSEFMKYSKTKKSIWLTLATTYGLKNNMHSGNIQQVLTLDDFFAPTIDI